VTGGGGHGSAHDVGMPRASMGEWRAWGEAELYAAGLGDAPLDAALLLSGIAGVPRLELYAVDSDHLVPEMAATFAKAVARRCRREPVQYILGAAAFHGIELAVGPGCLVPRPETELLVERVLALAEPGAAVLDLGTGSGAIALAVAAARPDLRVTGVDASPEALSWAIRNRDRLGLAGRVELLAGDLLAPVAGRRFGIIAANLPYIREDERADLPRDVREWEPGEALFGGEDGLSVIRRAIASAPVHLLPGGTLLLEIAPGQRDAIESMARAAGAAHGFFHDDLAGRLRLAELRWW